MILHLSRRVYFNSALIALLLSLIACGNNASATIILQDSFTRSGALNGSAPDIGTGTWSVTSNVNSASLVTGDTTNLTTNGSAAVLTDPHSGTSGDNVYAYYNIGSLLANATYTLSADVNISSGSWIALGFTNGTTDAQTNGYAWELLKPANAYQSFGGVGTTNSLNSNTFGSTVTTLKLVLTTDSNGYAALAKYYINTAQLPLTYTFAAGTTLNGIFFQGRDTTGSTLDNVTLDAVPEPGSISLMLMGSILFLVTAHWQRRQRLTQ